MGDYLLYGFLLACLFFCVEGVISYIRKHKK